MPGVWATWAEFHFTYEPTPSTGEPRKRPARRKTLRDFFIKRPDLHALIEDAANKRRDRLLNELENEIVAIASGPGDITRDFGKNGQVTRVRTDVRNKLRAIETLLKSLDPDQYGDRKRVEVDGRIDHRHAHAHLIADTGSGYRVDFESMEQALSLEERREFMLMLDRIEACRVNRQGHRPSLPAGQNGEPQ